MEKAKQEVKRAPSKRLMERKGRHNVVRDGELKPQSPRWVSVPSWLCVFEQATYSLFSGPHFPCL